MHLNQMHNYGKASNVMMSRNGHSVTEALNFTRPSKLN